ncbi:hypothetical protein BFL37_08765 [Clavibacter michiganensis]|uniref:Uncharacterized protein n=1 Tax=Clavibacter michiganensis TaxID=28447 RepID=A0A251YKU5_9MICO|nr:hypothetical protein BFL37_08765 [Clavibacter michiganensis]
MLVDGAERGAESLSIRTVVALHGSVVRPPRHVRTTEGWEVTSLLVGGRSGRGSTHRREMPRVPADVADAPLLVVCSGAGACRALGRLAIGDDVIVVGDLVPRRAGRPEDDAVELVAETVLARSGSASSAAPEPRIAP